MPVKNKNRQTNSGYEGVITGLNDKEKKVLEDAGIGGGIVTINCTNEQAESFTNNMQITFTEEQFNIIKNINYSYLALYLPSSDVNQTIIFSTYQTRIQIPDMNVTAYTLFSVDNNNTLIGNYVDQSNNKTFTFTAPSISFESIIKTITFEDFNNQLLFKYSGFTEYGNNNFEETKYIASINNNPVIGVTYMNYTFTEDKVIPLFGKHNILVPKDSADANILPCTASDNGKVLSVVNGEAQWATPTGGGGSGFKKVSANFGEMTWDVSQVDVAKDRIIILTDASGNSLGIASYSQINSNPFEFGYTIISKMLSPYVGNYSNSVEYNTFVLKLDGTIESIYEGYYYDDADEAMTFFNRNQISGKDNYRVTSLVVPALPADASTKTYTLKAVNGVLTWVEG